MHSRPGCGRVAPQVEGQRRQDARRAGCRRRAPRRRCGRPRRPVRRPPRRAPPSGRPRRRAAGRPRSGRPARSIRRSAQPSRGPRRASMARTRHVGEVGGAGARPRPSGSPSLLRADQVQGAGRLDVAPPQPGGACPGRWWRPGARRSRPAPGRADRARLEGAGQVGEDAAEGTDRSVVGRVGAVEAGVRRRARSSRGQASSAGGEPGGVGRRGPHQSADVDVPAPAGHPDRHAALDRRRMRKHGHPAVAADAVGGRGVVGEADLGLAATSSTSTTQLARRRRPAPARPPRPPGSRSRRSSARLLRALSTRTPRTSADGQPWLTGATWPGWPLPQLKAPPKQVGGPAADRRHRAPEVGGGGLVGDVAELAGQPAVVDARRSAGR